MKLSRRGSQTKTLKLVPIGANLEWSKNGNQFISAIVLACYNPEYSTFQTVGTAKCMNTMNQHLEELCDYTRPTKAWNYDMGKDQTCDVWYDPVQLWEVEADCDKMTESMNFSSAWQRNGAGIGFATPIRFVRGRCECDVVNATTSKFILKTYKRWR